MKKLAVVIGMIVLNSALFAGCGASKADTNTIILGKNGKITEQIVEEFSSEYYDEEELEEFLDEEVESYASENSGASVKMSGFSVEEGTAYLTMKYSDAETYADFKNVSFFWGTILEAETAGYALDEVSFLTVEDSAAGEEADPDSVLSGDQNSIVIVHEAVTVQVPGTILYVSAENTEVTAEDTVVITEEDENAALPQVYIVYE